MSCLLQKSRFIFELLQSICLDFKCFWEVNRTQNKHCKNSLGDVQLKNSAGTVQQVEDMCIAASYDVHYTTLTRVNPVQLLESMDPSEFQTKQL